MTNIKTRTKTHRLKAVNPYFTAVWKREKTAELRLDDREFVLGDVIVLCEYDASTDTYSGREIICVVTNILKNFPGLTENWSMLSFKIKKRERWKQTLKP